MSHDPHRRPWVEENGACAPTSPPQFFNDHRRGEVNELRQLLRLMQSERADSQKQRDAIKKVIAFMTLGIDVSRLFSEMIMACSTSDVVQKKMVYLYLSTYAESNPELALLVVNTLLKDAGDDDPAVRGLALRSLCSLRVSSVCEYVEVAVRRGLVDPSGYVRRTAAMGVLKLWHLSPGLVEARKVDIHDAASVDRATHMQPDCERDGLIDILFAMLSDIDSQVVANVIFILGEILSPHGGLPFTKRHIAYLLNRIRHFSEWCQCAILNMLASYVPESDEQLFDILNILDDRIKHSCSAVVLGAARCFLDLTASRPELRGPVLLRLKGPLLTLISTSAAEVAYVILAHLHSLLLLFEDDELDGANLVQQAFGGEYKLFFCVYSDPVYVKLQKLEILGCIASKASAQPILTELKEYVITEVDAAVVRKAVSTMGRLGLRLPEFAEQVVCQLLEFVELWRSFPDDHGTGPSLVVVRDLLRRNPALFDCVGDRVVRFFPSLLNPESVGAAVWILGEFGEYIDEAPYLLESLVEGLVGGRIKPEVEAPASTVQLTLRGSVLLDVLTAAQKLFLARPPEMQRTLGHLFELILKDDAVDFDVRDRAVHFYRFLQEAAAQGPARVFPLLRAILVGKAEGDVGKKQFLEDLEAQMLAKSTAEFNSLALLFKQSTDKFVLVKNPIQFQGHYLPLLTTASSPAPDPRRSLPAPYDADNDILLSVIGNSEIPVIQNGGVASSLTDDLGIITLSDEKPSGGMYEVFEALWLSAPVSVTRRVRRDEAADDIYDLLDGGDLNILVARLRQRILKMHQCTLVEATAIPEDRVVQLRILVSPAGGSISSVHIAAIQFLVPVSEADAIATIKSQDTAILPMVIEMLEEVLATESPGVKRGNSLQ